MHALEPKRQVELDGSFFIVPVNRVPNRAELHEIAIELQCDGAVCRVLGLLKQQKELKQTRLT